MVSIHFKPRKDTRSILLGDHRHRLEPLDEPVVNNNTTEMPVMVESSSDSRNSSKSSYVSYANVCFGFCYSFPSRCSIIRCRGAFRTASPLSTAATRCPCWQVRTTAPTWRKGAKVSTRSRSFPLNLGNSVLKCFMALFCKLFYLPSCCKPANYLFQ